MNRQAQPTPSPYITAEGHARLKRELDDLWRRQRPTVTRAVTAAAAEGDRSENAEYIYRKKQLREIDRRIRYLSKRLDVLRVVRDPPRDRQAVFFDGPDYQLYLTCLAEACRRYECEVHAYVLANYQDTHNYSIHPQLSRCPVRTIRRISCPPLLQRHASRPLR